MGKTLTLKESGIKPILRSLPDFQKGCGLGRFGDAQGVALRQNFSGQRAETVLQRLSFHRPHDAQPDRRSNKTAQMHEKKQPRGLGSFQAEGPRGCSENGREMSAGRRAYSPSGENLIRRGKKSAALEAAGAICHMIRYKGVAPLVQRSNLVRIVMRGGEEWQAGMSELSQACFEQSAQFGTRANLPVLPGRFQSGAMSEAAGGKRRIGQLP